MRSVISSRSRPRNPGLAGAGGRARPTTMHAMSTIRRIISVLTVMLAAALFAAGCSKKASEPLPDAAGLIQQSVQSTKALKSAHLDISVGGKIDGLPVKTLAGDLSNTPSTAFKGNAKVTMGGADIDAELVVLDGTLYAALTPNNWLDMGQAADVYDPSVILNPSTGLANMLSNVSGAKSEGLDTVGGVPTVKITGMAAPDAVNKLIPQLKAAAPLPATVWIEKDGPHQLVQAQIEQSAGNTVALTLSEWDKPVTVTKPAV